MDLLRGNESLRLAMGFNDWSKRKEDMLEE